jgi:hypothetical protein
MFEYFHERSEQVGDCLIWQGCKNWKGYGLIGQPVMGTRSVHRAVLAIKLPKGMLALHTCHNRACCNPDHLYEGTNSQNMKDRNERGTYANQWSGKVTDSEGNIL